LGKRIENPCTECSGQGLIPKVEEMVVRIPPGVEDGSVRTVRGAGEQTLSGTGDLHVHVRITPHPLFTREGADILCTVPVSFPQAVLGTQLEVPTLDGKVKMKLPVGTQSGRVFRLRGKGIPVFGGAGKGDQLVRVLVEVPEKISRKQRKLIEQLAEELGVDTHPQQQSFLAKLKRLFE
jgi:molecular chaperone DnaJ